MLSFAIVFFFAVTGLTLNHAEKFVGEVKATEEKGQLKAGWVNDPDTLRIAKLEIVEYLRKTHKISAALSDFRIDPDQIGISFKGPGFAADVFVDRKNGSYQLSKTSAGLIGVINDLHKGRDTGRAWSVFIDVSAILLSLVSLSGLILLLFLKKRRVAGILVALLGVALFWLIYQIWIK